MLHETRTSIKFILGLISNMQFKYQGLFYGFELTTIRLSTLRCGFKSLLLHIYATPHITFAQLDAIQMNQFNNPTSPNN